MNRLDRALAILLLLRSGKTLSAPELARRFEVSQRTIYRDVETLSAVGVPIYSEPGRHGGFRLVEGYFLPPVAFSAGEATSLLIGLALLDRLHARPFHADLETAAHKLLAVVPDSNRRILMRARQIIGIESIPHDIFHPERALEASPNTGSLSEAAVITTFLQCIFDQRAVRLDYFSPYRASHKTYLLAPGGILWDRDHWYLAGQPLQPDAEPRLWRADRVLAIAGDPRSVEHPAAFDVERLLGRKWLDQAIGRWADGAPVVIRITRTQAERLKQDWYYGHARFEDVSADGVLMTFGEDNRSFVFELLRWLGPGAELLAPESWRAAFAAELRTMTAPYDP